jgi:shikimate dehydrogenase
MTDRYAVIGHPVAHSKSPRIHARFAEQTGQDMAYEALLAPLDGFETAVAGFLAGGGKGANVTLPFKEQAYRLCDSRSTRAELAGAVNTLKFSADGMYGDNTDGAGLVRDLAGNLGCGLGGRRILLMGAGGAARGVLLPLVEARPARLVIANRTQDKAFALAARLGTQESAVSGCGYEALRGQQFDIVINATSAGLSDALPPLPAGLFAAGALAYDMLYGRETPFMRFALAEGAARVSDGLGMLVEQAAESFIVWRGVRPDTGPVLAALRAG